MSERTVLWHSPCIREKESAEIKNFRVDDVDIEVGDCVQIINPDSSDLLSSENSLVAKVINIVEITDDDGKKIHATVKWYRRPEELRHRTRAGTLHPNLDVVFDESSLELIDVSRIFSRCVVVEAPVQSDPLSLIENVKEGSAFVCRYKITYDDVLKPIVRKNQQKIIKSPSKISISSLKEQGNVQGKQYLHPTVTLRKIVIGSLKKDVQSSPTKVRPDRCEEIKENLAALTPSKLKYTGHTSYDLSPIHSVGRSDLKSRQSESESKIQARRRLTSPDPEKLIDSSTEAEKEKLKMSPVGKSKVVTDNERPFASKLKISREQSKTKCDEIIQIDDEETENDGLGSPDAKIAGDLNDREMVRSSKRELKESETARKLLRRESGSCESSNELSPRKPSRRKSALTYIREDFSDPEENQKKGSVGESSDGGTPRKRVKKTPKTPKTTEKARKSLRRSSVRPNYCEKTLDEDTEEEPSAKLPKSSRRSIYAAVSATEDGEVKSPKRKNTHDTAYEDFQRRRCSQTPQAVGTPRRSTRPRTPSVSLVDALETGRATPSDSDSEDLMEKRPPRTPRTPKTPRSSKTPLALGTTGRSTRTRTPAKLVDAEETARATPSDSDSEDFMEKRPPRTPRTPKTPRAVATTERPTRTRTPSAKLMDDQETARATPSDSDTEDFIEKRPPRTPRTPKTPRAIGTTERPTRTRTPSAKLVEAQEMGRATPKTPKTSARSFAGEVTPTKTPGRKPGRPSGKTPRKLVPSMAERSASAVEAGSVLDVIRANLHVSAVPESLPCREEEFRNIYTFVEGKISDAVGGCMYISGMPGTGKTATVHAVVRRLQQEVDAGHLPAFQYIEVNGLRLTEPRQVFVRILQQLTGEKRTPQQAQEALAKRFTSGSGRNKTILLLVDEVDMLRNRRQDVVYNLFDWPSKPRSGFIVLTIANTMDLPERLLMGRVTSRLGLTRLTFQPYNFKQLQEIVTARLQGSKTFNPEAVQLVARKVAAISGDARRALDICRRATELLIDENDCVTMAVVNSALKQMMNSASVKTIKSCSRMEKLFLEAVLSEMKRTGVEETNFYAVYRQFKAACNYQGLKVPNVSQSLGIVNRLGSSRILLTEHGRADIMQSVCLNISSDDIHYALNNPAAA